MNQLMSMYKQYLSEGADPQGDRDTHGAQVTPGEEEDTPRDNPMRPVSSLGEPLRHGGKSGAGPNRHNTEISQSGQSFYDTLPTLASLQQSVDVSYQPEARKAGARGAGGVGVGVSQVGSPRKAQHRMGRVRRATHGATPPSWFQPIGVLIMGVLFMLVGLLLTALGFSVKTMPEATTKFMQVAGPIFLIIGLVSLCGGYAFFTLAYGRHYGGNKKDANVPPPDPNVDRANWGHRQRHPQQNEQAVDLFLAKRDGARANGANSAANGANGAAKSGAIGVANDATGAANGATVAANGTREPALQGTSQKQHQHQTPAFDKVSSNRSLETPEASLFVAGSIRDSSKRLLEESAQNRRSGKLPPLRNVPKGGKLPPLNAQLPDSAREAVRGSGRKKGKGGEGFKWKEEDFEPMPSEPKDPSVFVVGAKPRQNVTPEQNDREEGY